MHAETEQGLWLYITAAVFVAPSRALQKKNRTPKLKKMQYSHRLSRHRGALLVSSDGVRQTTMALVSQHVRNVPFMHITHRALLHPHRTLDLARRTYSLQSQPVPCLCIFFLMSCANCISKQQLNPHLRTRRSEVPQSGLTLSSMYLQSTTLITFVGMGISSASVQNIFQSTQR